MIAVVIDTGARIGLSLAAILLVSAPVFGYLGRRMERDS